MLKLKQNILFPHQIRIKTNQQYVIKKKKVHQITQIDDLKKMQNERLYIINERQLKNNEQCSNQYDKSQNYMTIQPKSTSRLKQNSYRNILFRKSKSKSKYQSFKPKKIIRNNRIMMNLQGKSTIVLNQERKKIQLKEIMDKMDHQWGRKLLKKRTNIQQEKQMVKGQVESIGTVKIQRYNSNQQIKLMDYGQQTSLKQSNSIAKNRCEYGVQFNEVMEYSYVPIKARNKIKQKVVLKQQINNHELEDQLIDIEQINLTIIEDPQKQNSIKIQKQYQYKNIWLDEVECVGVVVSYLSKNRKICTLNWYQAGLWLYQYCWLEFVEAEKIYQLAYKQSIITKEKLQCFLFKNNHTFERNYQKLKKYIQSDKKIEIPNILLLETKQSKQLISIIQKEIMKLLKEFKQSIIHHNLQNIYCMNKMLQALIIILNYKKANITSFRLQKEIKETYQEANSKLLRYECIIYMLQ